MTAPAFCSVASVREYMRLNSASSDSAYSDDTINSNIRAAAYLMMKKTGRIFQDTTVSLKYTTNGKPYIPLPGMRSVSSVTQQGTALVADSTYYLIPDPMQSGLYTAIQLRGFGAARSDGPWYLHNPEWFDRDLDNPRYFPQGQWTSLPNDLVVAGSAGYLDADMPETVRHVNKVLAVFFTKRPDAILSGAVSTPDGSSFDLSGYPIEFQDFVREWKVGGYVESPG